MTPEKDKRTIAARLDETVVQRLERVARADKRSVANTVELLIDRALPELECEVLGAPTPAEKAEVAA